MIFANVILSISLTILVLIGDSCQTPNDANIQVLYNWAFADFLYPSQQSRTVAVAQRLYVPQNIAILDSDYYFSPKTSLKRFFVTTPQFREGIPATVSEISKDTNHRGEYLLKPFPNWETAGTATCENAVSVYRIHIDRCGLLWVLDTGRVNTFVTPSRICRPKVLIYDLNNGDTLIARYEFPDGTVTSASNLITLITESYREDCQDSIAYIADVNAYGLVVFDWSQNRSWRVDYNWFYPYPEYGTMTVAGVTFDLMDGIFGLALGPGDAQTRKLYFHSLASARETSIPVSVVKNSDLVQNTTLLRQQFYTSEAARPGQSSLEVMTDDGILIFASLPQTALYCWNSATPFVKKNLHEVLRDPENLQFISGLKLKKPSNNLLITTSRLQNYINGDLDYEDVKYRIIIIDNANKLIKGTPCEFGRGGKPSGAQPSSYDRTKDKGRPIIW